MEKNTFKYLLDIGLGISFLIVTLTGIFKFKGFREFLSISLSYQDPLMSLISKFHDWSGVVMAAIVLVHLILNWAWIISTTKSFFGEEENIILENKIKTKK